MNKNDLILVLLIFLWTEPLSDTATYIGIRLASFIQQLIEWEFSR